MPLHPVETAARVKTLHFTFGHACMSAYENFLALLETPYESDDTEEPYGSEHDGLISGVQTIVFSAMCFEAAIYDYAAWQLGDAYAQDHLEKLDVVAKWIVVPKLVCQVDIRKDRAPFARFKQLITARNRLVHHKSEPLKFNNTAQIERLEKENIKFVDDVHNAFRALVLMSFEMDHLLGAMYNPLPSYDSKVSLGLVLSPRITLVVADCKKVFRDSLA